MVLAWTNHNACTQTPILHLQTAATPFVDDSLQLNLNGQPKAAWLACGSAQSAAHNCGEVFHARSYRNLTRPKFQRSVAFNAASTTTVLVGPPGFLGVTVTLFPSFLML